MAWLQPVPDRLVTPNKPDADPADVAAARETIRLAFVAALQHLPPRQRAVLILRDVLRWQATEVATLLDMTPTAVHSTLPRARAALAAHDLGTPPAPMDAEHQALLVRYVDAFERYDVQALVALLHEDATMSMPPNPQWMQGPEAIARWWHGHGSACRGSRLLPTMANGSAAFAQYRPGGPPGHGCYDAFGLHVVEAVGGRLRGIHIFLESRLFPLFGFPARLGE